MARPLGGESVLIGDSPCAACDQCGAEWCYHLSRSGRTLAYQFGFDPTLLLCDLRARVSEFKYYSAAAKQYQVRGRGEAVEGGQSRLCLTQAWQSAQRLICHVGAQWWHCVCPQPCSECEACSVNKDSSSGLLIALWFCVQNSLGASDRRGRLARKASPPGPTWCARLPSPVPPGRSVRKAVCDTPSGVRRGSTGGAGA